MKRRERVEVKFKQDKLYQDTNEDTSMAPQRVYKDGEECEIDKEAAEVLEKQGVVEMKKGKRDDGKAPENKGKRDDGKAPENKGSGRG